MKNQIVSYIGIAALGLAMMSLSGCSALSSQFGATPAAPNKVENLLYTTVTNYVPVLVTETNTVSQTNLVTLTVTNTVGQVVTLTNTVIDRQVQIVQATNQVPVYSLTTSSGTAATIQAGGAIVNGFAPGVGTIASAGLLALLAAWGHLRSYKQGNAAQTVAQEVETLREFIIALPNGAKYDTAITAWLQQHQLATGVANSVLTIVQNDIDNPAAKQAAAAIAATLTQLGTPVPKQA